MPGANVLVFTVLQSQRRFVLNDFKAHLRVCQDGPYCRLALPASLLILLMDTGRVNSSVVWIPDVAVTLHSQRQT